ncbi:MAG TPA: HAMP domain-containing sensor histidine kinase [Candidatus Levybacteria bacterium]|nr:HAMP domain-containing sensor histidine kinase [Candidatus Levybacteria bacterium]
MEIVIGILFLSNFIFAGVVIHMLRNDYAKKAAIESGKKEAARKFYEARVLQEISEKIGYSLNVRTVAETIVGSFENLYDLTSISYALVENRSITLTTVLKEAVGKKYVDKVNTLTLNSLYTLDESLKGYTTSINTQQSKDIKNYIALHFDPTPEAYFMVPLVVNNICFGVITISSRTQKAFSKEDMDMVYKVVNQAERATERLEALIQSENSRMINLVSSLPTPAILFSKEGASIKISAANPIANQILKLPANPSLDDIVWRMEGNMQLHTLIEEVYEGSKSIFLKDVSLQNRCYKVYINPVYNISQKEVIGVTLSLLDVTLEMESEKLREKFTNMVVHELRAPMSSIKGGASLLLKGNLNKDDTNKMLHIISDSSERMLLQINDLLDAAKLEAGKFAVAPDSADINEIVSTKVEAFSYLASTKQITLDSDIDTAIPAFNFDKMRIDQVITNLISNSLKFTQANGHITLRTEIKDKQVVVSVIDNGMGIPAGKQNLLFVPFSQMQSAFRRDGSGLGLYISRGIIESHGGKIWMNSVEGKGTTVSFSLPMDLKIAAESPTPEPAIMPQSQKVVN